jgi:pyridoxal phosphate enzyme (YggS family)
METIAKNLKDTLKRIHAAEQKYGRQSGSVSLLAVSKAHDLNRIRDAIAAGQREFGENYLQEAIPKIQALREERLIWHFIGPVQSNKCRQISENFDWAHSVDRLKVAVKLSETRPAEMPRLNVCIQVNISAEPSKAGISPDQVTEFAHKIAFLPGLRLRGLMVIPATYTDFVAQQQPFAATSKLLRSLNDQGLALDTLSMGMSDDLEAAIAEGSTMVRVGTAIFGARQT